MAQNRSISLHPLITYCTIGNKIKPSTFFFSDRQTWLVTTVKLSCQGSCSCVCSSPCAAQSSRSDRIRKPVSLAGRVQNIRITRRATTGLPTSSVLSVSTVAIKRDILSSLTSLFQQLCQRCITHSV